MAADQRAVVAEAVRLLQAAVDVIASSGWLSPALAAMEMSQMVTQALWERDSPLLQLPGVTPELAAAAAAKDVEGVFGLIDMEEDERRELLQVGGGNKGWWGGTHWLCGRNCRGGRQLLCSSWNAS